MSTMLQQAIIVSLALVTMASRGSAQTYDSLYLTMTAVYACSNQSLGFGRPCLQQFSTVTGFVESSISSTGLWNIGLEIGWEFEPTDLHFVGVTSPVYTGGGHATLNIETDIIYQQQSLPAGYIGMMWCDQTGSSLLLPLYCDQTYVAFASSTPGTDLICHETGHAVGLQHGSWSAPVQSNSEPTLRCMCDPVVSGDDYLGAWAQTQINTEY